VAFKNVINWQSEIFHNLQEKFKDTEYDILSLLMIDRKGKVVKSKLITWNKRSIDEKTAQRFSLQMTQALKFSEDEKREAEYLLLPYGFNIDKRFDFS
jgi:hypothetical protein